VEGPDQHFERVGLNMLGAPNTKTPAPTMKTNKIIFSPQIGSCVGDLVMINLDIHGNLS
jgi:hypothetical protein